MSLRINFFGGPGVGKSTLAAQLFGRLKAESFNVEFVQEYVKIRAYQQRPLKSFDHVYTFASQLHTEDLFLQSGVNMIVTDSPILLQCIYSAMRQLPCADEQRRIADIFNDSHPSINFLVNRKVDYKAQGRYETAEAAACVHAYIISYLDKWSVPYTAVDPGDLTAVIDTLDCEYGIRQEKIKGSKIAEQEKSVLKAITTLHTEHGFTESFSTHQIWLLAGDMAGNDVWKTCNRLANKGRVIRGPATSEGETFAIDAREQATINMESFLRP